MDFSRLIPRQNGLRPALHNQAQLYFGLFRLTLRLSRSLAAPFCDWTTARWKNQMNTIRRFLGITLALSVLPALVSPVVARPRTVQAPRARAVRFEFEVKRDSNDTPHSRVFLNANGRRTLVLFATEGFQNLKRDEFASREIPRSALAACTGWWAGAGDNLYVVRRGQRLDVYRQEMDEQAGPFPFRKIKSIRILPQHR